VLVGHVLCKRGARSQLRNTAVGSPHLQAGIRQPPSSSLENKPSKATLLGILSEAKVDKIKANIKLQAPEVSEMPRFWCAPGLGIGPVELGQLGEVQR